jgi:membrane-associated protease RseP (regulator of RpoE activity)
MKTLVSAVVAVAFLSLSAINAHAAALGVTMNRTSAAGATVNQIVVNSPAAQMGLQAGDRILAINGQPAANAADVTRIIGALNAGDRVELSVARGAWQGTLSGVLGSTAAVFNSTQQFQSVSTNINVAPAATQGSSGFPFDFSDNGSRGVAASYGGGGY